MIEGVGVGYVVMRLYGPLLVVYLVYQSDMGRMYIPGEAVLYRWLMLVVGEEVSMSVSARGRMVGRCMDDWRDEVRSSDTA